LSCPAITNNSLPFETYTLITTSRSSAVTGIKNSPSQKAGVVNTM